MPQYGCAYISVGYNPHVNSSTTIYSTNALGDKQRNPTNNAVIMLKPTDTMVDVGSSSVDETVS